MAEVRLSDVVIPELYADYQKENPIDKTDLFTSGVIVTNPLLNQKANTGGSSIQIPVWGNLDVDIEPNIASDDPTDQATPNKIGTKKQIAHIASVNNGWSTMDLATILAGESPMKEIASQTSHYWAVNMQKRMVSTALGVLNDNVANDSGDMVHDISIEAGDSATSANLFGRTAFTGGAFTLGDHFADTTAIAVHSVVYKRMVENDDVEQIRDSEGTLIMETYMGRRLLVNDRCPVIAGTTNGYRYVSVLFGGGVFGFGEGEAPVPVEVDRDPAAGNGSGQEILWERKIWMMHPFGYQFTDASVAGQFATLAELENAANWTRVFARKNVPMAFVITNG